MNAFRVALLLATGMTTAGTLTAAAFAQQPNAAAIVRRAVELAGGEQDLRRIAATRADFTAAVFALGQEQRPGGIPPLRTQWGTVVRDFARGRTSTIGEHAHRHHRFPYRVVAMPGDGYRSSFGNSSRSNATMVEADLAWLPFAPERVLLTVLESSCQLVTMQAARSRQIANNLGAHGEVRAARCISGSEPYELLFDDATGRLLAFEQRLKSSDGIERVTRIRYDDYRRVFGGPNVTVPHSVQVELDDRVVSVTQYGRIEVLAAAPDSVFALPNELKAREASRDVIAVTVSELAPGVQHLSSGAFGALAVVQGDSIVMVEAPDSRARTKAMLDTLRARFPRQPVRLVVNSHHHSDHAGGLPVVMEAGITVLTHRWNRAFVEALAHRAGRPGAKILEIRDSLVLGSGASELRIYAASVNHADATLVAYLPALRFLFAPDLGGGGPWEWERVDLAEIARRYNLTVNTTGSAHGPPRPWTELEREITEDRQ